MRADLDSAAFAQEGPRPGKDHGLPGQPARFGLASTQYTLGYNGYYPLVPYIGSSIYPTNPGADDNLFVLYLTRLTPNVNTFTCPATNHQVRTPKRIYKMPEKGGTRYSIFCDPNSKQVRNDFECHAQLIRQHAEDPAREF